LVSSVVALAATDRHHLEISGHATAVETTGTHTTAANTEPASPATTVGERIIYEHSRSSENVSKHGAG